MITVHHLDDSRSQRILWLLEEMGVDYEVVNYQRDPETLRAPAALERVHPLGKSPVITDGDITIAESGAIVEYVTRRYADHALAPAPADAGFPEYVHWLHFAEGSAVAPLLLDMFLGMLGEASAPLRGTVGAAITRHLDYLESSISDRPYFCGDHFTAADIQMAFVIEFAEGRGKLDGYPALRAYLDRVRSRPAYLRALERGGNYDLSRFA